MIHGPWHFVFQKKKQQVNITSGFGIYIYIYIICEWLAAPSKETPADPVSSTNPAVASLFYAPKL